MFILFSPHLLLSTLLLVRAAIASPAAPFEDAGPKLLLSRQEGRPLDCPTEVPGTQTCDQVGFCYDPTLRICCGKGDGVTCPIGTYCTATGCCPTGEVCSGRGGTVAFTSIRTDVNTIISTSTSTIAVVTTSTSTAAEVVPTRTVDDVPTRSPSTTGAATETETETQASPTTAPPSSDIQPTSVQVPPAVVPVNATSTFSPPSPTSPSTPAQFTGGAVANMRSGVGGVFLAGGALGLLAML